MYKLYIFLGWKYVQINISNGIVLKNVRKTLLQYFILMYKGTNEYSYIKCWIEKEIFLYLINYSTNVTWMSRFGGKSFCELYFLRNKRLLFYYETWRKPAVLVLWIGNEEKMNTCILKSDYAINFYIVLPYCGRLHTF